MNQPDDLPLPFTFGLLLFGCLMVLPFWALGAVWNRLQPERLVNPWILPSLVCAFVALCFAINYAAGTVRFDYPMVIVALVPVTLGCPLAVRRWRRPDDSLNISRSS